MRAHKHGPHERHTKHTKPYALSVFDECARYFSRDIELAVAAALWAGHYHYAAVVIVIHIERTSERQSGIRFPGRVDGFSR